MSESMENAESFADLLAQHETVENRLRVGQKIQGTVIAISGDNVFVDLGVKQDGVMDKSDILDAEGNSTVAQGDQIEAYIVSLSPQGARLSRSMAGSGAAALEDARDAAIPVDGRIKNVCKGGYQVEVLGKTAFCPGSQMEIFPGTTPEELVGRQMQFLITRVEGHGRNVVISRRALIEKERQENLDKLLDGLNIGGTVEGKISRLVPFGAFVELAPSVEGLVHISELSWSRVANADEAVSVGDPVRAKVLSLEQDAKGQTRISLSLKQAQGDPWEGVMDKFAPGDTAPGIVRRLTPFGAFVEIAPGIEGLAHVSEFSWEKRVTKPEDFLAVGDSVPVKIKDINPESRRLSLSIRDAQGDPWEDASERFPAGAKVQGKVEANGPHGVFVALAPGIVGLLPKGAVPAKMTKIAPGTEVSVTVRSIDLEARRISLGMGDGETEQAPQEKDWRSHARSAEPKGMGIMAQALQNAIKKKKGA